MNFLSTSFKIFIYILFSDQNILYMWLTLTWASLIAQLVKNPSAMQETLVGFLGQEYPLEKG